ncbi:hypothetical protein FACS1894113_2890 [Alphaproteobacteria bacterium]|nr:hypothetical protein FACS1894113_2890 [Alphaproteobacteria bacterium]
MKTLENILTVIMVVLAITAAQANDKFKHSTLSSSQLDKKNLTDCSKNALLPIKAQSEILFDFLAESDTSLNLYQTTDEIKCNPIINELLGEKILPSEICYELEEAPLLSKEQLVMFFNILAKSDKSFEEETSEISDYLDVLYGEYFTMEFWKLNMPFLLGSKTIESWDEYANEIAKQRK